MLAQQATPDIALLACLAYSTTITTVSKAGATRPRLTRDDVAAAREVSDLLGIPLSTVLEYARRGVLPGHKLGRRWIFLRDEIEAAVRGAPGLANVPPEIAPQKRHTRASKRPKRYPRRPWASNEPSSARPSRPFAGPSKMGLGGLEPPTSWVRYGRSGR